MDLLPRSVIVFEQCLGGVVRRRLVYMHYLDAVNFEGGNKQADPSQEALSYFLIEQLSSLIVISLNLL